jgi:hypothetical protein
MKCSAVQKLAPLYVGEDLDPEGMEGVARHLGGCQACRVVVEEHRASRDWLRMRAAPRPSDEALSQLHRSLRQRLQGRPPSPPALAWLSRAWEALRAGAAQPAMAVGVALVVGAAVFSVLEGREPRLGAAGSSGRDEAAALAGARPGEGQAALVWEQTAAEDDLELELEINGTVAALEPGLASEDAFTSDGDDADEAEREALRIEIHTSDPDLQIIWFSPGGKSASAEN